jgi:uncharacterized protein
MNFTAKLLEMAISKLDNFNYIQNTRIYNLKQLGSNVSPKLTVKKQNSKGGFGIFATHSIQAGELLIEYKGYLLASDRLKNNLLLNAQWTLQVDENMHLVAFHQPEAADFVNHSCNPND